MKCSFCKMDIPQWDLKIDDYIIITKDVRNAYHIHGTEKKGVKEEFAKLLLAGIDPTKSHQCHLCIPPVTISDGDSPITDHLLLTRSKDNHFHTHGNIDNKEIVREMAEELFAQAGIEAYKEKEKKEPPSEIVFKNRQAIGDILTMTAGIRDFHRAFPNVKVGVNSTAMHIWDNNPNIDHDFSMEVAADKEKQEKYILEVGPGFLTNKSNMWNLHLCNAFRVDIENKLGITIPQGEVRPDIWMTEEEYNKPPMIEGAYWVFISGGEPGWPVKMYPNDRWQEVINSLPEIQFVQLGLKGHPYPVLENVINFMGKTEDKNTGIRDLFHIFLHAQGTMGLVSMQMHLAAAFNLPAMILAGAREPMWFTHYLGQQYIQTNGCLPCAEVTACWKCKVEGCVDHQKSKKMEGQANIPPCVDIIHPQEIVTGIRKYYDGGRLKYGQKIQNKFFKNIVKEAKGFNVYKQKWGAETKKIEQQTKIETTKNLASIEHLPEKYGVQWGHGSITMQDWKFIDSCIEKYKFKTVLEFGCGLSTLLFSEKLEKVISYEVTTSWVEKVRTKSKSNVEIRVWDGHVVQEEIDNFDFSFVDGPIAYGGAEKIQSNRETAIQIAVEKSKFIIIHDAARLTEMEWQKQYLPEKFSLISKSGCRCTLWARKDIPGMEIDKVWMRSNSIEIGTKQDEVVKDRGTVQIEVKKEEEIVVCRRTESTGKTIRFAFNGRGDGGAEKSITWMANTLYDMGYSVIYHSPNGVACGTFQRDGNKNILIKDYTTVDETCDILFYYTNDSIWNLHDPKYEKFYNLHADRKVMGLNYKVGDIGKVEWSKGWDHHLFLSSDLCNEVKKRMPEITTCIMAPPTPIEQYLGIQLDYELPIKIGRHSSQGDSKYPKDMVEILWKIINCREDVYYRLMPKPSFLKEQEFESRVIVHPRNNPPIPEFLSLCNCFNYILPDGYTEGGPKVVMEAMAAGLPVITHNRSGMKDRVVEGTGWLCETIDEMVEVIRELTPEILKEKGTAAKEYARQVFIPGRWINEILGKVL